MENKPLLIFVHGMFCHAGVWNEMVAYFGSKGYDCKAINLPYHDQLPHQQPHPKLGTTSIKDYVAFVRNLVRGIDREYILIGHSMGGLITMISASLEDVNPRSIILLSPAAPAGILGITPRVLLAFARIMSSPNFWEHSVKMTFCEVSYSMLNMIPKEQRREIYDSLVYESGLAAFEMGFWLIDSNKATRFDPTGINCPITIFIGTHDHITPPVVVKSTAKLLGYKKADLKKLKLGEIPHVELIFLPGHGHWLLTEMDFSLIERMLKK